eukprot:GEMP01034401.1.p1 GENE.GEMP01034401.1~~GEMP01034401.1.p1  ORF type:complete len:422 (+),score=84.12 GEMP01034401.1:736-2001(+)
MHLIDGTLCTLRNCGARGVAREIAKELGMPAAKNINVKYVKCDVLGQWEDLRIDWLVIGFHKMGTSTVARALSQHPNLTLVVDVKPDEWSLLVNSRVLPSTREVEEFNQCSSRSGSSGNKEAPTGATAVYTSRGAKLTIGLQFAVAGQAAYTLPLLENPLWKSRYQRFMWCDVLPRIMRSPSSNFQRPPRIVFVVRDPVQCFYSSYHFLLRQDKRGEKSYSRSIPQETKFCVRQGISLIHALLAIRTHREFTDNILHYRSMLENLAFKDNPNIFACTLLHNRCAAAFQLHEACALCPLMCQHDRMKIVRAGTLTPAKLEKLAHWVSHGIMPHAGSRRAAPKFGDEPTSKTWDDIGGAAGEALASEDEEIPRMNVGAHRAKEVYNEDGRPDSVPTSTHAQLVESYADEYEQLPLWMARYGQL